MSNFIHYINKCVNEREIHRKEIQEKQEKHLPDGGGHRLPEAQHEVRREGDPRVVQVRLTLCTAFTISVVKKILQLTDVCFKQSTEPCFKSFFAAASYQCVQKV